MSQEDQRTEHTNDARSPDLEAEEVELDPTLSDEVQKEVLRGERLYAILGLVVGGLVLVAGIVLIVLGFSGSVEFGFTVGDASAHVTTGVVGIVVMVIGAGIVWATRYRVKRSTGSAKRKAAGR